MFSLLAIPFFIYAGDLMVRGGIAQHRGLRRIAGQSSAWRLGQESITAATLFSGIPAAVAEGTAAAAVIPGSARLRADYAVNVTSMAALIALLIRRRRT